MQGYSAEYVGLVTYVCVFCLISDKSAAGSINTAYATGLDVFGATAKDDPHAQYFRTISLCALCRGRRAFNALYEIS
jgi:hypothetical protein